MDGQETNAIEQKADSLTSREKKILDRLRTIRLGKSVPYGTIIQHLLDLVVQIKEQGSPDLLEKLISSYDGLKSQEELFIAALREEIAIRGKKMEAERVAGLPCDGEDGALVENAGHGGEDLVDLSGVHETIAEAEKAAALNEQLVAGIDLNQRKKEVLEKLYNKASAEKVAETNKLLQQVEFAKLKLTNESESVQRKGKLLERLRKEAVRRGYRAPVEDTIQNTEEGHPDAAALEEINRNTSRAAVEKALGESSDSASVLAVTEPQKDAEVKEEVQSSEDGDLHAKLSQRLISLEQRKLRIKQLRSRLRKLDDIAMDRTYDDAVTRLNNLTSMREKLESLQEVQPGQEGAIHELLASDESPLSSQEEAVIRESSSGGTEHGDYPPLPFDGDSTGRSNHSPPSPKSHRSDEIGSKHGEQSNSASYSDVSLLTEELIDHVRQSFEAAFHTHRAPLSRPTIQSSLSEPGGEDLISRRLDRIEETLASHAEQLGRIGKQKLEEARQHLSSGKAILEKQKALKKIHQQLDNSPHSDTLQASGLNSSASHPRRAASNSISAGTVEADVCSVMGRVLAYVGGRDITAIVNEVTLKEIKSIVLEQLRALGYFEIPSSPVVGEQSRVPLLGIDNAIEVALGRLAGSGMASSNKEAVVEELSETLYNELSFLQLIRSVDTFVAEDGHP